jgi:hypothetical protein
MRLVVLFAYACCSSLLCAAESAVSAESEERYFIQLQRDICYGTCAAYAITVTEDGEMVWEGKEYVKRKGTIKSRGKAQLFERALSLLESAQFRDFATRYQRVERDGCKRWVTDSPSVIIHVKTRTYEHRVSHYLGCQEFERESELLNLEKALDELLSTKQWIGGR